MFPLFQDLVSKEKDHCEKNGDAAASYWNTGGSRKQNILPVIISSRVAGFTLFPVSNCQLGLRQCIGGFWRFCVPDS